MISISSSVAPGSSKTGSPHLSSGGAPPRSALDNRSGSQMSLGYGPASTPRQRSNHVSRGTLLGGQHRAFARCGCHALYSLHSMRQHGCSHGLKNGTVVRLRAESCKRKDQLKAQGWQRGVSAMAEAKTCEQGSGSVATSTSRCGCTLLMSSFIMRCGMERSLAGLKQASKIARTQSGMILGANRPCSACAMAKLIMP